MMMDLKLGPESNERLTKSSPARADCLEKHGADSINSSILHVRGPADSGGKG